MDDVGSRPLALRESIYLDLVRVIAALLVILGHSRMIFGLPMPDLGHEAVVIFFVLSGFVISNVADTRETDMRRFMTSRLSRLWSVLIPAMILTIVCDVIGRTWGLHPGAYRWSPADHPLIRAVAALSFTSQAWVSIQPFSNFAWWSLPIEFWYYATFAAFTFILSRPVRLMLGVGALVMSGPQGILLAPVWAMGVAAQRRTHQGPAGDGVSAVLSSVLGLIALLWLMLSPAYWMVRHLFEISLGPWISTHLDQAIAFPFDWALGVVLAVHLAGAHSLLRVLPIERLEGPIRWCASISFAAYLFHMPLLILAAAFLPAGQGWIGLAFTLGAIAVLGPPVEGSKRRWRHTVQRLWDRVMPGPAMPPGSSLS